MSREKIDCLHYDEEFDCCMLLSYFGQPMPVLQPCVESPCDYYVKGCFYCEEGDEKCGTCVRFFDYHEDGGGEKCSSAFDSKKCMAYKHMNYCSMCGRKLKGEEQ